MNQNEAKRAAAEAGAQVFKYDKPADSPRSKSVVRLARTDYLNAHVQVVKEGGENNLHSHPNQDGFYYVLAGRARFYGEGDTVLAEVGKNEGVLIPKNFPYWFESSGTEPLELLLVHANSKPMKSERESMASRVDYEPLKAATKVFMPERG
jgi:mannose-6-phosphate isomerase-like protein (cupin superfamily)